MSDEIVVEHESIVDAPNTVVWARVTSAEGINDELAPILAMRMPRWAHTLTEDTVPIGRPIARVPLLLFGVLPVEYDHLTIAEFEPGRRFHEKSTMMLMRRWEHERTLDPLSPESTRVHDRLTFELRIPLSRIPGAQAVARRVIATLFAHRHRRLAQFFERS
ncbi:hypothetical protein ACFWCF_07375 [Rhodococcus sp. NPDC060090]|uniref:hypothetical protein n=1 Tax=Rhodococcus sp. NPDC060090 TaxID=3347056 RepID=UPI0036597EC3